MRLLFHIPYLSSLRNFLQSGFLDFVVEQDHSVSLIVPSGERTDLDPFLSRWPEQVEFVPQEPLFPHELGTRVRRRWRLILHGLSLELLRNENVTFRRQANRHSLPVRLFCRAPGIARLLRLLYPYLEYLLPVNPRMLEVVRSRKPSVVAGVACLADPDENDIFRVAQALGIPSAMILHSWDNPSSRGAPPVRPDKWIVWGEEMKGHLARYYGVPANVVEVTGAVQFNIYRDEILAACDRRSFLKDIGLDPDKEVVLYAPTHMYMNYSDLPVLRLLIEYARGRSEVQIWFRPHPHSRELRQTLAFAREMAVFVDPNFLAFVNSGLHDRRYLPGLTFYSLMLSAADVVISNMSTIALETAIVGRPIVIVGFDCPPDGVNRITLPMSEYLQHPTLTSLLVEEAVVVPRRREDFFSGIDEARRIRFSNSGAVERLRRCANRITGVGDGRVFERLLNAVASTRCS